jgi:dTDP-4-amino-4,6-dideoxygalactose transaminase
MTNKKIWLSSPHMSGNEQKYIQIAFDENYIAPLGTNLVEFEKELGGYVNIDNTVMLTSGTSAIHTALLVLGITSGDEVMVPSFTFSASVNPIIYQHATPIFIDSEPDTWNMSPELLEVAIKDRISKGKKPKAIIIVHLYGMPAKVDEILEVANRYDIPVVEDAAEALGSKYNGKHCGTFGLMSILSFNGNKIITTSGGGALLSNNKELIDKARFLATQAKDDAVHYQHTHIGYNYRMSNIVAGVGRGQLEVIDKRVEQRRNNFLRYKEFFKSYPYIKVLEEPNEKFFSNYWLTTITIDKGANINREDIRLELEKHNIESRPLWKPMHLQPVFESYTAYLNGVSEDLFDRGLCLPSGSNLTDADFERIFKSLSNIL